MKNESELFTQNKDAIRMHNASNFTVLIAIASLLMALLFFCTFIPVSSIAHHRTIYLVFFISFSILFVLRLVFKKTAVSLSAVLLYIVFTMISLFSILISLQNRLVFPYCALPCILVFASVFILDKKWRVISFSAALVVASLVISFFCKNTYAFRGDVTDMLAVFFACIFIGDKSRRITLSNMDLTRTLTIQRNTDSLTGMPNRRVLFEKLAKATGPFPEHSVQGMLMVDIDSFKKFNDSYGHQAGDDCLRKLGDCFMKFGRDNGLSFYRYGGEEFIALSSCNSAEALEKAAAGLCHSVKLLNVPFDMDKTLGRVSISVGYSYFGDRDISNLEQMIHEADAALYCAKTAGKNCIFSYADMEKSLMMAR